MSATEKPDESLYGIGAVARLTGLTDHTIRVWERRYGAVVAERSANGRRVYGPADVEKLGLLKRLTDKGVSIGQIATSSVDELQQRIHSMSEMATPQQPERIAAAVLGDFLPGEFSESDRSLSPVDVVVADSSADRFSADLQRQDIDVIVLENAVLDSATIRKLKDYLRLAGAARGVIVYRFGRARDIEQLRDLQIVALRSPANTDEVCAAIMRAYASLPERAPRAPAQPENVAPEWHFSGEVAARRFTQQQLARLARISTSIDCECPHHLAQLVSDLSAFEVYSANCASKDQEDAALHAYLHRTTAEARALIEVALEKVAHAEGIDV